MVPACPMWPYLTSRSRVYSVSCARPRTDAASSKSRRRRDPDSFAGRLLQRDASADKLGWSWRRVVAEIIPWVLPLSRSWVGKRVARFMFLYLEAQEIVNSIPGL